MAENKNTGIVVGIGLLIAYFLFKKPSVVTPVVPPVNPVDPPVVPPPVIKYTNGFSWDTVNSRMYDGKGFLIADGVSGYNEASQTVTYSNGYTLNFLKGLLTNDKGVNMTQAYNFQNLTVLPKLDDGNITYFPYPKKIYGYSSLAKVYWYIDGDITPYSLQDSEVYYYNWLNFGGSIQQVFHDGVIFSNVKVYNAMLTGGGFFNTLAVLYCLQDKLDPSGNVLEFQYVVGGNTYKKSMIWKGAFYSFQNYGGTVQLNGIGVVSYDAINNLIVFDDKNYLDIVNHTLYNSSGAPIQQSNVISYVSDGTWSEYAVYDVQAGNTITRKSAEKINIKDDMLNRYHDFTIR
jgi:hypothetical protein